MTESKKPFTILLASPRGFCAGVDRAIQIVERIIDVAFKLPRRLVT